MIAAQKRIMFDVIEEWLFGIKKQLLNARKSLFLACLLASWFAEYIVLYLFVGSVEGTVAGTGVSLWNRKNCYASCYASWYEFWEPRYFYWVDAWLGKPRLKGSFDEDNH